MAKEYTNSISEIYEMIDGRLKTHEEFDHKYDMKQNTASDLIFVFLSGVAAVNLYIIDSGLHSSPIDIAGVVACEGLGFMVGMLLVTFSNLG